jgi:SPP1 family predicted phage head-tail adaptor
MKMGDLNRRIVIERPTGDVDGANQPTGTWERVASRWARPLGKTGMATIRDSGEGLSGAPGMYSWRIKFTPDLFDAGMRVNYKGRYFDIREIRHDFAHREWTDLVCESGVSHG